MIKAIRKEFEVTCETCNEPAIRREAEVLFPGKGGCRVSYDTHTRCLTEKDHVAAIKRMDTFHGKVFDLEQALNRMPQEDRLLTYGAIVHFEINTLCPDACSPRTHVKIEAEIKAATMSEVVESQPLELEGLDTTTAFASIQELASTAATKLKYRFNQGLF